VCGCTIFAIVQLWRLTAGMQVAQVSRWLGHVQPTITLNVYGDWVPEMVENPLPEPAARKVVLPLHG
jgi:integrase